MLVTHTVNILPQVDNIVFLVDGTISEIGSYQELLQRNGAFAEFLHSHITVEEKAGAGFPGNPNELESFFPGLSVNCFLNITLNVKKQGGGRGLLLFTFGKREKRIKLEKPVLYLFYYGHLKPISNHSKLSLCVGKNVPVKLADSSPQNWFLNKLFHLSRKQSRSKQNYPLYMLFFKPPLDISTLRNNSL